MRHGCLHEGNGAGGKDLNALSSAGEPLIRIMPCPVWSMLVGHCQTVKADQSSLFRQWGGYGSLPCPSTSALASSIIVMDGERGETLSRMAVIS